MLNIHKKQNKMILNIISQRHDCNEILDYIQKYINDIPRVTVFTPRIIKEYDKHYVILSALVGKRAGHNIEHLKIPEVLDVFMFAVRHKMKVSLEDIAFLMIDETGGF